MVTGVLKESGFLGGAGVEATMGVALLHLRQIGHQTLLLQTQETQHSSDPT